MVEVLNISTGIYPRGGSSKVGGKVLALAYNSNGEMLWAGNDKVLITLYIILKISSLREFNVNFYEIIFCVILFFFLRRNE